MNLALRSSPFGHGGPSVASTMRDVLLALLPGVAAGVWLFGWPVLLHCLLAMVVAVSSEAGVLWLRGRSPRPALDGSALVTAVLLALSLPPLAPWWLTVTGTLFAIVIVKQLYGGLGANPFNPAMAGYVMLLVSFPLQMTTWPVAAGSPAGLLDGLAVVFADQALVDALSGATPLDALKTGLGMGETVAELRVAGPFGYPGGDARVWIALAYLAGGLWLIRRGVVDWRIPVSVLGGLAAVLLWPFLLDPGAHASPLFHLASGAAVFGAFFIATDPVTAATTARGRIVYGAGIGILTAVIRTWGGYPEGMAFAVLLMNMAVPTIDHYTRPRVYGHP